jgi:hypothetical protein
VTIQKEGIRLLNVNKNSEAQAFILDPAYSLRDELIELIELDHAPCRLPELDITQLSDPEKGLWELWGGDAALCKRLNLIARDPGRDIQRRAVAIDFGTSSTVVACSQQWWPRIAADRRA